MSINRNLNVSPLLTFMVLISVAVNSSAETPLIDAARNQDSGLLTRLLADGADPNGSQADGATALHWAAYRVDHDLARLLIEAGADVNAANRLNATALYLAAKAGDAGLISLLLEAGANPNVALDMGETPIMTAARSGTAEGVRALIEAGANVNAREISRNQTALMWAAAQGHVEVIQELIAAGAELDARSKVRPMLMFADATNGGAFDQGVMENLGGYSPLLFAARAGHVEAANILVNAGADIDGEAGNGTSPLVVATHSGHSALAQMLLVQGADANSMGAGYNALHAAILRSDRDTVAALLANGADPNVRLEKANPVQRASEDWVLKSPLIGATPYWIAASFREAEIMQILEGGGADPLLSNQERFRLLRDRASRENPPPPEVVGGFESTLQAAIRGDSTRQRYYVTPNPDPAAEERRALASARVAIEHGVDINHSDFTGSMAIHDASSRLLPNVIRVLAENGADVNAQNGNGMTPLDLALASARRPNFFGFDTSIPGQSASEVLLEFGAKTSDQL
ncbi:MAG: ankyrin repeat domain-containing protein [Gammaproteobacteria bacterium]|nr:ankyrin repeat domain-containing protein [Gammaproteobacteria bacterium]MDD9959326.1 ankyrin repeat domain-containing protein [Gammaproteobacteria bacterium]